MWGPTGGGPAGANCLGLRRLAFGWNGYDAFPFAVSFRRAFFNLPFRSFSSAGHSARYDRFLFAWLVIVITVFYSPGS